MLEWQSAEQMESEWIKFKSDKEWQSVKAESEKDGPIVEKINVIVLKRLAGKQPWQRPSRRGAAHAHPSLPRPPCKRPLVLLAS